MSMEFTRREVLGVMTGAGKFMGQPPAPAAPVSVVRCRSYGAELRPAMERLFDQLGGLSRLVKGKVVAIKLNLTGSPSYRLGHRPLGMAQWVHQDVVGVFVALLGRAGAKRIRLLESPWSTAEPLEEYMLAANWDPRALATAAPEVEFENTNYLGRRKAYVRFPVPKGGLIYPAYDLSPAYRDCDVFVSLAKLKEHATAGVTLSMKNCFGITPCTIYGDGAPEDEPGQFPRGGRTMLHTGYRQPPRACPQELDPRSPREGGYRVPRVVADLVAARPIDLAIIDGIESMAGGEGPWVRQTRPISPGLLIAGLNPVCTDAVATALMGFDPMAERGTAPFERCDNTMRLGEGLGIGTCNLARIEVRGASLEEAVCRFRA